MIAQRSSRKSKILDNTIAYLVGPIDQDPNLGTTFRKKIQDLSKKRGLKIIYLDPTAKVTGLAEDVGLEQDNILKYKKKGCWGRLTKLMKRIVRSDLRQVDLSDYVIVFIDTSIHMCGSYHELIQASIQKKPVLIITKNGKKKTPAWLFGIIDHRLIFDDIEKCIDYLCKVNDGKVTLDDRWVLFRKELKEVKD